MPERQIRARTRPRRPGRWGSSSVVRAMQAGAVMLLASACVSQDIAVTPGKPDIASIADIIRGAPADAQIRVLVLHGMGADENWNDPADKRPPVAETIRRRLADDPRRAPDRARLDLGMTAPQYRLAGKAIGFTGASSIGPSGTIKAEWPEGGEKCASVTDAGLGTAEPYLDTQQFESFGRAVTVQELSYWPLLNNLKCRLLVATDTALIGTDTEAYRRCAARFAASVAGAARTPGSPPPARINAIVKARLFEWGLGDAALSMGDVGSTLHDTVRAALACVPAKATGRPVLTIFVTESLGSYVLVESLLAAAAANDMEAMSALGDSPSVYMLANQWSLLALSDVERQPAAGARDDDEAIATLSAAMAKFRAKDAGRGIRQIVAFNDPSDVLTLQTPATFDRIAAIALQQGGSVTNVSIAVSPRYLFGQVANPIRAHLNYRADRRVLDMMIGTRTDR